MGMLAEAGRLEVLGVPRGKPAFAGGYGAAKFRVRETLEARVGIGPQPLLFRDRLARFHWRIKRTPSLSTLIQT